MENNSYCVDYCWGISSFKYKYREFIIRKEYNYCIDNGDISNGRFFLFEEMFKIFVSRPITGIGPLSTFSYYNDYLGHNVYLQVLCEMGVIGFIALLYMLISGLKYRINVLKRKNATDFDFLALFIQLFIIIYGFFGNPIFSYVFIIPYILFSAD